MNAQHTPGPWIATGRGIEAFDGTLIATVTSYKTLTPRQQANARLIAAAPELLAIAQSAVSVLPDGHQKNAWLSVIAKTKEVA